MDIFTKTEKFTILDKIYTVKPLNIIQLANIRNKLVNFIKKAKRQEIVENAEFLPAPDRTKFLTESFKAITITDDDVNNTMMSTDGITLILSTVLNESDETVSKLLVTNSDILVDIFNFVMQIETKEETKEIAEKKELKTFTAT